MNQVISTTLSDIIKNIDNLKEPVTSKCSLTTIENILDNYEKNLDNLKSLYDYLLEQDNITKVEAFNIFKRVRAIYSKLDTYKEIHTYWLNFKDKFEDKNFHLTGEEFSEKLLLNKNIIVLNRTIFAAKRTKQTLEKSGALKRNMK